MLLVRFKKGQPAGPFLLTAHSLQGSGALATIYQYQHNQTSHAHLMPSGVILRFGTVIGRREDLEVLREVADDEFPPTKKAMRGAIRQFVSKLGFPDEED